VVIGIVGSEAAKFTALGEIHAREKIRQEIELDEVTKVVSGGCHLGGVDIWAIEIAKVFDKETQVFLPEHLSWEYYKKRNLQIVAASDLVVCVTVDRLPDNFSGMRFDFCYHCGSREHVKSGGCWTMKQAKLHGKQGELVVVENL